MKILCVLICLFSAQLLPAQDFLSVYAKINRTKDRQVEIKKRLAENYRDSAKTSMIIELNNEFYRDSILPITRKVLHLTFPDIIFSDLKNKDYSISDFNGKEVIVNYNYLYCQSCMNRIDTTLDLLKDRDVKMLVLFGDQYRGHTSDLKDYGDKVIIGFINDDTKDLISLGYGDDSMYYLSGSRQIEFFDKIDLEAHEYAWLVFLRNLDK